MKIESEETDYTPVIIVHNRGFAEITNIMLKNIDHLKTNKIQKEIALNISCDVKERSEVWRNGNARFTITNEDRAFFEYKKNVNDKKIEVDKEFEEKYYYYCFWHKPYDDYDHLSHQLKLIFHQQFKKPTYDKWGNDFTYYQHTSNE
ncbi:MAG: hypothetical protein ACRCX2_01085 [Paraclostridium sp.]